MKSLLYLVLSSALFSSHAFASAQDCGNKGDNNPPCPDECCTDNSGANPVNVFRGSLIRDVTDLQVFGPAPFEFKRTYNSRSRNYTLIRWEMGTTDTWQHNWQYELREATQTAFGFNAIVVRYPRGSEKFFYATDPSGTVYVSDANFGDRLYPTGTPGQFLLRSSDGMEFTFRKDLAIPNNYLLDEVRDGKGSVWTLTYQFLASRNRLTRIANNYGKFIDISGSKRPNSNF
jgi:Domain of unknown function (DUF6531)